MNRFILLFLLLVVNACGEGEVSKKKTKASFSEEDKEILAVAKDIIKGSYYASFITIDSKGQPRVRIMEPFAPEDNFDIWLATNPRSRKVQQLKNNPHATIHYFDKNQLGYVSIMGKATIVNDNKTKATKWKDGWEKFYVNQKEDYMLIHFIPETLELIGISKGFTGNERTWAPHLVVF